MEMIRLLTEGQLADSAGGIYNPGAVSHPTILNERTLLMRKERHADYHNDSSAVLMVEKIEKLRHGEVDNIYYPQRVGFPPDCKVEDFRLFYYQNQLYAIHTLCITQRGWRDATLIKPVISKVSRHAIELVDWCDLPYIPRKIGEKNWLPIVHDDELYLLYGLDPLKIYKLEGWSWREVYFEETGLADYVKKLYPNGSFLSLSAIEKWRGNQWIGFWHIRHEGVYKQGMFILNMETFKIENFTGSIMQGGDLEGNNPNCLYVSGLVKSEKFLEVYVGEADSHTSLIELPLEYVEGELGANPYTYTSPLRALFLDAGVGDFICMCYALIGWMHENKREVKLFVKQNLQLASTLKIPGIKICVWNGEPFDIDLTSNGDTLPEGEREEYNQKVQGSLKGWYAKKLKSGLRELNLDHIVSIESNAIVLFPFAAKEDRCWNLKNWIELANDLIESGERVIICDGFPARCVDLPGEHQTGTCMLDVFGLVKGAKLVICNESGGAHISGLFDTPTIVLSGWLDPKKVYDFTNNDYIFKRPLQSISVAEVKEKIASMRI